MIENEQTLGGILGSNTLNFTQKFALDGRLARYALAGAALLATSGTAKAGIIFSGVLDAAVTPGSPLNVNFDAGPAEFSLNIATSGAKRIYVQASGATAFNLGPLSFGAPITIANTTSTGSPDLFKDGYGVQPWDATTHGYIGVRFTTSGQQYLGWAELTLDQATPGAILNSIAYENTPNTQITAGQVPEPSSMALFAAGAAGLAILRRRRKHA